MKAKETIIFSKYTETDELGSLRQLTDKQIMECMDEYAHEVAVEFLGWYIQGQPSKFEVDLVIKRFMESEYFKRLQP
jgi:hypothetical protein